MRFIVLLLTILVPTFPLPSNKPHPLSDEVIQLINDKHTTWSAGRNFKIYEYELFKSIASGMKRPNITKPLKKLVHSMKKAIPESFDARENWSECADIIGMIRDQSKCGACWAFAAVESMSDRICIHSNGQRKMLVSAQDLLTCPAVGGCHGGWASDAWNSWVDGLVTGGLYGKTDQGCKSYFLPSCDDHPHKCTDYVDTPDCVKQCDDSSLNYEDQETYGQEPYEILTKDVAQIQMEILTNGPVEAGLTVFEDFANYKSGIYQHVYGEDVGGHYVKIFGWGVEDGVEYWLAANSWNEQWGENGFFRILRGVDEAGIETSIYGGLPDFSRF